ncbi:F0F1 ATP synthase subunit A [Mastigocoleus sp. MO_188.B34]|uniref:F0F1 ATP synthase subunit A n=1 Tax=Mastigocoleus sp. MO_188.B34 TaxID=3036635 RepID=UPI002639A614|nr:F0F1 ATP synthase subunit A [Mastigocoleus sp. MO_188.B34]MDJ0696901.1 F0F1 ATP synthase subunit A [Mastigocoleus sp. MO_188.B34]
MASDLEKILNPDTTVLFQWGTITLNATIVFTWVIGTFLVVVSWLVTRNLSVKPKIPRLQSLLEIIVEGIANQIREVSQQESQEYIGFIGTLFLFIAVSNILAIVPFYQPPTGSLSTTTALALCVFIAVPFFGIMKRGAIGYLKNYIQPTPFMLPFNIIGEFSRTLALAVRLFGNIMSGSMLAAILLSFVPFFVPIPIQALGLLIGVIQAYVFAMLAMVYIASATTTQRQNR